MLEIEAEALFDGVTKDLRPSERLALVYIRSRGPVRQTWLNDVLSVGGSSEAVRGLEERGLVVTRPAMDNSRSPWVYDPDWHEDPLGEHRPLRPEPA